MEPSLEPLQAVEPPLEPPLGTRGNRFYHPNPPLQPVPTEVLALELVAAGVLGGVLAGVRNPTWQQPSQIPLGMR